MSRYHAAQVKIRSVCVDRTIALSQVSPDWVIVKSPTEPAPCEAEIELEIDEGVSGRRVFLPDGINLDSDLIRVVPIEARVLFGAKDDQSSILSDL